MFLTVLKEEAEKIEAKANQFLAIFDKDVKNACTIAGGITAKIIADLDSPDALVIETLLEPWMPQIGTYAADVTKALEGASPALSLLQKIGDTNSIQAILQRVGSEISSILHGGKHNLSFYIAAFENIVFGVAA